MFLIVFFDSSLILVEFYQSSFTYTSPIRRINNLRNLQKMVPQMQNCYRWDQYMACRIAEAITATVVMAGNISFHSIHDV